MTEGREATKEQAPNSLFGFLDYYLVTKAPIQIPDRGKEWLVKYGPWFLTVSVVLMLQAALLVLGFGAVLAPLAGAGYATGFGILGVGLLVEFVLTAAALPGLFARNMYGWRLLFYSEVVSGVTSLLGGNILATVVVGVVGMWVLFQVRPLYKS